MKRLRVGVLGCSAFAGRAMLPALAEVPEIALTAAASRGAAKARDFARRFSCAAVKGYGALLRRRDIDAVYIPLPPALHARWVAASLAAGKHVLIEKPFTADAGRAALLLREARERRLLVLENFLFERHSQYAWVRKFLASGGLGEVRLLRATFTIPALPPGDIRYQAALGGGALLDLGAYMVRFAGDFLGRRAALTGATARKDARRGITIAGAAQFAVPGGAVAQTAFGFDAHYQCLWEFFGTKAKLVVERGFTPPPGLAPVVHIERSGRRETITLPADDHYRNMWRLFARTILAGGPFTPHWEAALRQAEGLEQLRARAAAR